MFNAGRILAFKEMIKSIPTGPFWFSEESIKAGGVNQYIQAIANEVGDWLNAVYGLRPGTYLANAAGNDLDLWGFDIGLTRRLLESDSSFRARISAEILAKKLTKPAIEEYLATYLGVDAEVYLPWQDVAIHNYGYDAYLPDGTNYIAGRSGTKRRSSPYYTAGVIDIRTDDFNSLVRDTVNKIKGAPIKAYFTPKLSNGGVVISDSEPDILSKYFLVYLTYVSAFNNLPVFYGYGQIRSGGPETASNTIRVFNLTADEVVQHRLWDDPSQPNTDFRATSMTWDCVADLTWNDLLDGHERQVSSFIKAYNSITTLTTILP